MSYQTLFLADPGPTSGLARAVAWLEIVALGPVALSVAIIAVGGIGLLLLNGRLALRRGTTVVLGCFLVFGAPVIAAGLLRNQLSVGERISVSEGISSNPLPEPSPTPKSYDPYAGASLAQ